MLKYVAIISVDKPALWSTWHSRPTNRLFTSPISDSKEDVQKWLDEKLEEYPDARINEARPDKEYYIQKTIIAFDEDESEDTEYFLNKLIRF